MITINHLNMKKYIRFVLLSVVVVSGIVFSSCSRKKVDLSSLDYGALKEQALQEILQPVHPGVKGEVPFWNKFAFRYIYAPVFDLDEVEGAGSYVFTATAGDVTKSFTADTPTAALSPIWNDIPYGPVRLEVQAVDKEKQPVGEPAVREFTKCQPFAGPYEEPKTGYMEAALKAAEWIHTYIGSLWLEGTDPDLSYLYNAYPCKIWSGIIQNECFLAKNKPESRDSALKIAHNVADALIENSLPEEEPLAYFPPTYYTKKIDEEGLLAGTVHDNSRYTMFVEAVSAADALLDLYDNTGERKYFDHACHIAETYRSRQAEDGSWPMKVDYYTGEPFIDAPCMSADILILASRLKDQYKVKGFERMIEKGEAWLWDNTIVTFNFNGQFEDVPVKGLQPYLNLTNCTARYCIEYLLSKPRPSKKDIAASLEMARFTEDQFTYWTERLEHERVQEAIIGVEEMVPFVYEQYQWRYPVDASNAGVAMAWMQIYQATGDLLALAKAKALVDAIVRTQIPSGYINTALLKYPLDNLDDDYPWVNCTYHSITALVRFAEIVE